MWIWYNDENQPPQINSIVFIHISVLLLFAILAPHAHQPASQGVMCSFRVFVCCWSCRQRAQYLSGWFGYCSVWYTHTHGHDDDDDDNRVLFMMFYMHIAAIQTENKQQTSNNRNIMWCCCYIFPKYIIHNTHNKPYKYDVQLSTLVIGGGLTKQSRAGERTHARATQISYMNDKKRQSGGGLFLL